MAGRVETTNPFDKAARYTAQKMRGPLSPSMGNGAGAMGTRSPSLPSSTTTAGTSGGVVYTVYTAMTELDSTETNGVSTGTY